MGSLKSILQIVQILAIILSVACSTDLTRADLIPRENSKTDSLFFKEIPIIINNQNYLLHKDLTKAYSQAINTKEYPLDKCYGKAKINVFIKQHEKSIWPIGIIFIPFWPALPIHETWEYKLNAQIICKNEIVKSIEFKEEEQIKAFWYGFLRSDLLNKTSKQMHKKLVDRFTFELGIRQADLNCASDY